MTTPTKRITLSISQIAPLIGLDNYNNLPRIICEIWRKYDSIDFKIFENKLKAQGYQIATSNEMNDIWEADEALGTNILQQVKELNANITKTSGDMVAKQNAISKYINDNIKLASLDANQKQELTQKVCSLTNKTHGITNEDAVLAEFCKLSEKTIKSTQDWVEIPMTDIIKSYRKNMPESSHMPNTFIQDIIWVIVGKSDAITTDNELVEAKMRQKALFKKVRDYENVQVQLYLHALKFEQAYLVESYTNNKGAKKDIQQIYVNEIKYDESYVLDVILANIAKFIEFFGVMMSSNELKEGLLKGDKDRKIFKKYESEFLGIEHNFEF